MRTNNPGKGPGQVPEEIEIEGERIGGGGGKRERGREGGTHPNAALMVNHQLGLPSARLGHVIQAMPEGPSQRLCKYTGKDIPGRIPAAVTPDGDDMTGVGGTTRTIDTTAEEGSKITGGVETDAVNAIDGTTVAGGPEGRRWCPAAPDNSERTAVLTRDASRSAKPLGRLAGIGLDPEDVVTVEVSMELDTVTAPDAALTSEIGTSPTVETAIPVVAAAVTVRHLWIEPAQR